MLGQALVDRRRDRAPQIRSEGALVVSTVTLMLCVELAQNAEAVRGHLHWNPGPHATYNTALNTRLYRVAGFRFQHSNNGFGITLICKVIETGCNTI